MKYLLASLFLFSLLTGVLLLLTRNFEVWRGRRACGRWRCPDCGQPFGGSSPRTEWRRKSETVVRSGRSFGPVLHCSRCDHDYLFTWDGQHLPADESEGSEVIDV